MSTTPANPGFCRNSRRRLSAISLSCGINPRHAEERLSTALRRFFAGDIEQGVLLPNLFLPSLEQTGLVIPVGNWAIEAACRQLHFWTEQGFAHWTLSFNLSPVQFEQPDIFQTISSLLQKYNLSPSRLILEVTESTALKISTAVSNY